MSAFTPLKDLSIAFVQYCYVVTDLESACHQFHERLGVGPFVGGSEGVLENHIYRGSPALPIKLKAVFVQSGDINIELVELVSAAPSAFHDLFDNGRGGLHHAAMFSDDYEAQKQRFVSQGMDVVSEFSTDFGAKICYVDARETLGHFIELYPENAIIRAMYSQARNIAGDWSANKLIVPWDI
ncbi:MAG: VOC family protein [Spongiibacteraceae bacterium]